jgi:hypothetical protein
MITIQPTTQTRTAVAVVRTGFRFWDNTYAAILDEEGNVTEAARTETCGEVWGHTVDADGNSLDEIRADVTAEEYDAWGQDDVYLTNILLSKNSLVATE